ncbi:hypothetical protein [Curtobacterium sp. S6]|uniref:hypothetical protein n=1 Tax=Curtobacterium sp. S6 TaxID=1479623 RepID=UPI0004AA14A9|nr:hypothetical protein [Curtobacterium sp. S6]
MNRPLQNPSRFATFAVVALLGLTVAGCGGSSDDSKDSPSGSSSTSSSSSASASPSESSKKPSEGTQSSSPEPSGSSSSQGNNGGQSQGTDQGNSGGQSQGTEQSPTPAPKASTPQAEQEAPAANGTRSERGNLVKSIGQPAVINGASGQPAATMVLNGIQNSPQCTAPYAGKPENGRFIRLNMDVSTGSAADMESVLYDNKFYFSEANWKFIGADGNLISQPATVSTYSCIPPHQTIPLGMGPGEKTSGAVILDIPQEAGTLVYTDPLIDDGWEWQVQ